MPDEDSPKAKRDKWVDDRTAELTSTTNTLALQQSAVLSTMALNYDLAQLSEQLKEQHEEVVALLTELTRSVAPQ